MWLRKKAKQTEVRIVESCESISKLVAFLFWSFCVCGRLKPNIFVSFYAHFELWGFIEQ